jgi:hypothetical protein
MNLKKISATEFINQQRSISFGLTKKQGNQCGNKKLG